VGGLGLVAGVVNRPAKVANMPFQSDTTDGGEAAAGV
jgi:hypothetical protein